jgi:hypothetical protein
MELFDAVIAFLGDIPEVLLLKATEGKAIASYLTDIFGKLNILNCELQGPRSTLLDAKAKICAFLSKLRLFKENVKRQELHHFSCLMKCAPLNDDTVREISTHLDALEADFNKRFADLKALQIPGWLTQPFITELADVEVELQDEIAELQYDANALALHKIKSTMMWLDSGIAMKFPLCAAKALKMLLPFPSSYLVETGFSAVNDILTKKRNRLKMTVRGDLRVKLSHLQPDFLALAKCHQAQGSH